MALPAVHALARLGSVRLDGPDWVVELFRDVPQQAESGGGFDLAVLLKPSWGAAWAVRAVRRRVGLTTDGRWGLLTTAVVPGGRHRTEDYAAVARAAGADPRGLPVYRPDPDDLDAAPPLPPRSVVLLPGTASGATVRWPHYSELAHRLADAGWHPHFTGGPDDEALLDDIAQGHPVIPALPIGALAHMVADADAVIGNDSGLTHLAAAARRGAGTHPRAVHVLFASTDPQLTGPVGATWHRMSEPPRCWPCYRKRCELGLSCQGLSVDDVLQALA